MPPQEQEEEGEEEEGEVGCKNWKRAEVCLLVEVRGLFSAMAVCVCVCVCVNECDWVCLAPSR